MLLGSIPTRPRGAPPRPLSAIIRFGRRRAFAASLRVSWASVWGGLLQHQRGLREESAAERSLAAASPQPTHPVRPPHHTHPAPTHTHTPRALACAQGRWMDGRRDLFDWRRRVLAVRRSPSSPKPLPSRLLAFLHDAPCPGPTPPPHRPPTGSSRGGRGTPQLPARPVNACSACD